MEEEKQLIESKLEEISKEIQEEKEHRAELEEDLDELKEEKSLQELQILFKQKQQELADLREINRLKSLEAEKLEEEVFKYDAYEFFECLQKTMYIAKIKDKCTDSQTFFQVSNTPIKQSGTIVANWQEQRLVMRPTHHAEYMVSMPGITIITKDKKKVQVKEKRSRKGGGPLRTPESKHNAGPPLELKLARNGKYIKTELFKPKLKVSGRVMTKPNTCELSKRVTGAGGNR